MRAAALLVILAVMAASLSPQVALPDAAPDHTDLVIHLVMHAALAGTLGAAWPGLFPRTLLIALGFAIGLETAQIAVPGRAFDLFDLAANLAGATLGTALAWLYIRRFSHP